MSESIISKDHDRDWDGIVLFSGNDSASCSIGLQIYLV